MSKEKEKEKEEKKEAIFTGVESTVSVFEKPKNELKNKGN
jgi:hypothetical protein